MSGSHLALVTGAGKRLGRAIALKLADAGCDVAVHYNSSRVEAQETMEAIHALGRNAACVQFDLADADAFGPALDHVQEMLGRPVDVLVNSASLFEWDDIASVEPANLTRHFERNLFAPVMLTRMVVERSGEGARGLILNLLDTKLANTNPDHLSYTLTKYALEGFTAMMARGLAPRFRVNAIAPGHTLPGPDETDAHFEAAHGQTPLARGPTPEDIADAAAYLLGARAVTGQTLIVDGGAFMRRAERDVMFR
jgi:NAD(P)-dependent dehydrogenase (short-subunit alcohol dehydrogenase family)